MKNIYQKPMVAVFISDVEDVLTASTTLPQEPIKGSFWGAEDRLEGRTE